MSWTAIIPLIVQYGIPVAEKLWSLTTTKAEPTQAEWDALKALASQSALSQMQDALTRAGIALDDPKALPFLDMVK